MKFYVSIIMVSIMLSSFSCTSDSDVAPDAFGWKVSKYIHDNDVKTSDYSGYLFDFQSNGILVAKKDNTSYTGTWKEVTDSSRPKFIISYGTPSDLAEISEDWLIVSKTNTSIKLTNTSGNAANIGIDILEFSK